MTKELLEGMITTEIIAMEKAIEKLRYIRNNIPEDPNQRAIDWSYRHFMKVLNKYLNLRWGGGETP